MIRDTSHDALLKIQSEGLLEHREWQVYQTLFHNGPMTQSEVWQHIVTTGGKQVSLRSVSPRFAFLRRRGCIKPCEKRKCNVTGFQCLTWDVTRHLPRPIETQESELVRLRRENRYLLQENEALKKKLARWGRPPNTVRMIRASASPSLL